jgi:hypothetical protein
VRYRCFEVLALGRFCVQSADFLSLPVETSRLELLERQYLELLGEAAPDEREQTHESLGAAIQMHQRAFDTGIGE